jgi:DNA polymerase III subunit delta
MKIVLQQLSQQLKQNLAPIYLLYGDEYILLQDACTQILQHAQQQGFTARESFHVDAGFTWESFATSANNLSIFNEASVIELNLQNKLNTVGTKLLLDYAQKPPTDKILIIKTTKLDAGSQKSSWFKAIESCGIIVQIRPINLTQFPNWFASRLQQAGIRVTTESLKLLIDYTAGNLLAAIQEIEKLQLLYGKGQLTPEQIRSAITDNAHFDVFNLIDSALQMQPQQTIRILQSLQSTGVEPAIILWAIARELRNLISMRFAMQAGTTIEQLMTQHNVWPIRRPMITKILQAHTCKKLNKMLQTAAEIDLIIKGAKTGDSWQALGKLYLNLGTRAAN